MSLLRNAILGLALIGIPRASRGSVREFGFSAARIKFSLPVEWESGPRSDRQPVFLSGPERQGRRPVLAVLFAGPKKGDFDAVANGLAREFLDSNKISLLPGQVLRRELASEWLLRSPKVKVLSAAWQASSPQGGFEQRQYVASCGERFDRVVVLQAYFPDGPQQKIASASVMKALEGLACD